MKTLKILKRDGSVEEFNFDKIRTAVTKAYNSCGKEVNETVLSLIHSELKIDNYYVEPVSVETIQDIVERIIGRYDFDVAKDYILYREKHKQNRFMDEKLDYIFNYIDSDDSAANLSNTDDNANVCMKTAANLENELYKNTNRTLQRRIMKKLLTKIDSLYKDDYIKDLEHHIFYQHDETGLIKPYCSAYTMYPLLVDGTSAVDGTDNKAPKHLSSFVGQFQNLVFLLSSQKKGAGAYGEFFNFFSYFCEKEWGEDYYKHENDIVTTEKCLNQMTIGDTINQYFQSVTYYINETAQNRGQSPFTNFNVFDSYYWHSLFDDFAFPDFTKPNWDAVNWLQKRYMKWLNNERTKSLLTFPVMTVCLLTDGNDVVDKEYKDFVIEQWAEGDSFFVYLSENADSVSSCCRLRNEITDNTFSSTTGLTGVQTGSCNVMTLNLNRIVQDCYNKYYTEKTPDGRAASDIYTTNFHVLLETYLKDILDRIYDYQKAYKTGLYIMDKKGMFPQTKAGYIALSRLYCTLGVNGLNEAARFLGMKVTNNEEYMNFASWLLGIINDYNKENSTDKFRFNLELVPAESLGVKNYNWDKADNYWVPDDVNLYNSYIYDAHDPNTSILDKIAMHGSKISKNITGGQASHLNLEDNLTKEQYAKLLEYAVQQGNNYLTFNVVQTQCDDCKHIAKHPFEVCPKCGSTHVTKWTRVIGYLRPVKSWGEGRKEEFKHRYFANTGQKI